MSYLLPLLIVTAPPPAPTAAELAEAVEVFRCDFEQPSDQNYDGWPDDWTRRVGRGYPRYLKVAIADDHQAGLAARNRCLRIELNGGAAAIYSPPISISPRFSYVLSGRLKTEGLQHDVALYSIIFYDQAGNRIESHDSAPLRTGQRWTAVRIGPITPAGAGQRTAVISLQLRPAGKADLAGAALFDEIRLIRLPRMTLRANRPHNIYTDPADVLVTCEVSGIPDLDPQLKLELLDVDGRILAEAEQPLRSEPDALRPAAPAGDEPSIAGVVRWRPPLAARGFYRVRAAMHGQNERLLRREITLAVVSEPTPLPDGQFGWSLPRGESPLPLKSLAALLRYCAVRWVKFPVWYGDRDGAWADRIAEFVERLNTQGIEMVGVLDQPPAELRRQFAETGPLPVASIFVEPKLWRPAVDPVMTRLSMKVRWWQLGRDDDRSFMGFPDLEQRIGDIKRHLEKFGQEIHLGISWHWLNEMPQSDKPPWAFLCLSESPPFTRHELQHHLEGTGSVRAKRWLVLAPLSRTRYTTAVRVRDLVTRMLAAKMYGADAIFVLDPFDPDRGLVNEDGTPGELLLPWTTTARLIGGKTLLGSIQLPGGSENYILARGEETVMVVWNDHPVRETVFLGDEVRQIDLWGRQSTPRREGDRQVIPVGPEPSIVTGLNRSIALWRMGFAFDERPLSSVFGQRQATSFRVENPFPQGVGGRLELHTPEMWGEPKRFELKLAAGAKMRKSFDVLLNSNARTGRQPVRADFQITANRTYRFSVYRTMQVGLGDVTIDVQTQLDRDGNLVVTQNLVNKTDRVVSFDCLLFAPNYRRQRIQVLNLGRGHNTQTYFLPHGEQLVGKTLWLRAEQIGSQRVLNYHVTVER